MPFSFYLLQNVVDRTDLMDSSSEGGSASGHSEARSGAQDGASMATAGFAEGEAWDTSGVPTDYTFKVGHLLRVWPVHCPTVLQHACARVAGMARVMD
jgi:hypothetical protein